MTLGLRRVFGDHDVPCPLCGAGVGEPCHSRGPGGAVYPNWIHRARVSALAQAEVDLRRVL